MHRQEIAALLRKEHDSFTQYIEGLSDSQFVFAAPLKWTAGQQLKHIYRAVWAVVLAFGFPKFMLRIIFGKADRPGRSYEEVVQGYQSILKNGGKASWPFTPAPVTPDKKKKLGEGVNQEIETLCLRLENFEEDELDVLCLGHPLLGKMTLRESLYLTIYHVGHHRASIERGLSIS